MNQLGCHKDCFVKQLVTIFTAAMDMYRCHKFRLACFITTSLPCIWQHYVTATNIMHQTSGTMIATQLSFFLLFFSFYV